MDELKGKQDEYVLVEKKSIDDLVTEIKETLEIPDNSLMEMLFNVKKIKDNQANKYANLYVFGGQNPLNLSVGDCLKQQRLQRGVMRGIRHRINRLVDTPVVAVQVVIPHETRVPAEVGLGNIKNIDSLWEVKPATKIVDGYVEHLDDNNIYITLLDDDGIPDSKVIIPNKGAYRNNEEIKEGAYLRVRIDGDENAQIAIEDVDKFVLSGRLKPQYEVQIINWGNEYIRPLASMEPTSTMNSVVASAFGMATANLVPPVVASAFGMATANLVPPVVAPAFAVLSRNFVPTPMANMAATGLISQLVSNSLVQ